MELYSDSEKYLGYANEEVNAYEQYYERVLKLNEILPEEKQTKDIPPIILTQKIMHQKFIKFNEFLLFYVFKRVIIKKIRAKSRSM